jgi:hypothetical protein
MANHPQIPITMNDWTDFWFYEKGANVIPANTKGKITFENWSSHQDKPIPVELHEQRKKNGEYENGIAIILGKIWRGPFKDKYLIAIDLDNKKAIEEFCGNGLEELKQQTLVEQHADPNKMHIYFIVEREIPNKSSDKTNTDSIPKIDTNEIPALEVKSNGKGIMFCASSPHQDGSNYRIIGTLNPEVFNAQDVQDRISAICKKYGITYGFNINSSAEKGNQISIEDLWKSDTVILEGHNRHLQLLRIMESELQLNKGRKSLEDIKQIVQMWHQSHCKPPLDDREFEKLWKQAIKFISKNINNNNENGNGHYYQKSNISKQQPNISRRILGQNNHFEYIVKSIKKTVKCEDALIRQILYTGFSTYVEDDPLNLGVLAPTSEGKTYAITESLQYFPNEDVLYIGQMSPKVLVRQKGILIDKKSGEPIDHKIQDLRIKVRELIKKRTKLTKKDIDQKLSIEEEINKIDEDIRQFLDNSKTLIDLSGKILVFLEPPQYELWNLLKPILSHDKKEIEFPFVDKTANSNAETKDVVVRGYPACIFCSAKDESKWEIWNEIKSRILITSPNMVTKKYQESKELISQSKGYPNLIQQQLIISNEEIETTKNYIFLIKQKIFELKTKNKFGKISLWIPYNDLLQKELPANKGTDVRFAKRIFSLLNIVPIVKSNLRMVLNMEGESSIIADIDDLKEVLLITQNFDGLPKFKAEFFNDIFYPCFTKKTEPDANADGKKTEEIIAVTTRELCDYFKEIKKKPISTDNIKHTYLNQLINEGIIDYTESKINSKQNIYYPLLVIGSLLSTESIMSPIDKESQQSLTIYEKIIKNVNETWIFCEITKLIHYRLDQGNIALFDYINDPNKFQILDKIIVLKDDNKNEESTKQIEESEVEEEEEKEKQINPITIGEFIKKYVDISFKPIDNKPSNILLDFAKRSPFLSILAKIDSIDISKEKEKSAEETPQEGGEEEEKEQPEQQQEVIGEEKESTEEKYQREQEEIAKWG